MAKDIVKLLFKCDNHDHGEAEKVYIKEKGWKTDEIDGSSFLSSKHNNTYASRPVSNTHSKDTH